MKQDIPIIVPPLSTSRLMLRPPEEADIPALIRIAGDWEVARRLSRVPHPYTEEDARFFLTNIAPKSHVWAITQGADMQGEGQPMIGVISLSRDPEEPAALNLGYYIGQDHWGHGYATEAGRAVVAYGLEKVGPSGLKAQFHADNPASGHILEKLGFMPVGKSEFYCLADKKWKPDILMRFRAEG